MILTLHFKISLKLDKFRVLTHFHLSMFQLWKTKWQIITSTMCKTHVEE